MELGLRRKRDAGVVAGAVLRGGATADVNETRLIKASDAFECSTTSARVVSNVAEDVGILQDILSLYIVYTSIGIKGAEWGPREDTLHRSVFTFPVFLPRGS